MKKAIYKCPHCGAENHDSVYLPWGNENGLGVGNDFGAFCYKCMGRYDKRECFVRELKESEVNFECENIPYFLKKKLGDKNIKKVK